MQLGLRRAARSEVDDDLVELLLACHERIRRFTSVASAIAAIARGERPSLEAVAPEEIVEAARGVRRYFEEALPLHARDEEESVAPRLRATEDAAVIEALDAMSAEHHAHEALVAELVGLTKRVEAAPDALAALADELTRVTSALGRAFEEHLAREEALVFPAAAKLSAEARAEAVRELRARRAAPRG